MSAVLTWPTVISPSLRHYSLVSSSSLKSHIHRDSRLLFVHQKNILRWSNSRRLSFTNQLNHLLGTICSSMANSDYSNGKPSSAGPAYAEIVVIRHGETEWNADGRIQGHLDVELNDVGRQQAAAVAERLSKEPKISAIYSSDLKRAFETAQIIANSCGGLEVTKDPDLRERHLGDLQGLVYNDAVKICPEAHLAFVSSRADQEIPGGGESRDQVHQRCTSSLQRIGNKHKGERVVVVTHGGVIRSLHKRATPRGQSAGKILNTSVNVFHLSDGDEWTIEAWGDVSHLNQMGFLKSGFGGDTTSVLTAIVTASVALLILLMLRLLSYATVRQSGTPMAEFSSSLIFQGHVDIELNEVGRQQAAAVAERLSREHKISAVYSSDLKRAFETAHIIANCCGKLEVIKDLDLRERHLGDLQGLVYIEAVKIYPEIDVTFVSQTADREIPGGGETRDQVYQRCTSSLQRIGKKHKGERVVVVTHGGVIRALHKRATPQGQSTGDLLNTSVNVFHLSDGDVWTVGSWDDVCHLN